MFTSINTYNIYVGLNDKNTYKQEIKASEAMKKIKKIVTVEVGGATFSNAFGYWVDDLGNETKENSIVVKIVDCNDDKIESICTKINKALNQNCVMVEKTISQIAFI